MLQPAPGKVLVKQSVEEFKTRLFIPDGVKNLKNEGKVLAIGPGPVNRKGKVISTQLRVGDVVLFNEYDGFCYMDGPDEFIILDEVDIFALRTEVA